MNNCSRNQVEKYYVVIYYCNQEIIYQLHYLSSVYFSKSKTTFSYVTKTHLICIGPLSNLLRWYKSLYQHNRWARTCDVLINIRDKRF